MHKKDLTTCLNMSMQNSRKYIHLPCMNQSSKNALGITYKGLKYSWNNISGRKKENVVAQSIQNMILVMTLL